MEGSDDENDPRSYCFVVCTYIYPFPKTFSDFLDYIHALVYSCFFFIVYRMYRADQDARLPEFRTFKYLVNFISSFF